MRPGHILLILAALTASAPSLALAQDSRVKQLERTLKERDRVIRELIERVEALERRAGVKRQERGTPAAGAETPPPPTRPAGPGAVVVDEEAAERALDRSLSRAGAVLLRPGVVEIEPSLSWARREDRTPAFVTSGMTTFAAETEHNSDRLSGTLGIRIGLPLASQLELSAPYRWRRDETVTNVGFSPSSQSDLSGHGFGDVRVGLATTLAREGLWRPDLVGRVTWDTATGRPDDGGVSLGGGFHEVTASLSAIKRQDPLAFTGGIFYTRTGERDDIRPGALFGASFGSYLALSPETSIRFILSGAWRGETEFAGADIAGSDQMIGGFTVGGSTLLAPGVLLNLSAGIGLTDDADDFSLLLSLPIRFSGGIF